MKNEMRIDLAEKLVIPGDILTDVCVGSVKGENIKLGPGLIQQGNDILACKSGILKNKIPNFFWVECHQRRYIPTKGENVLGIVTGKQGEAFKVDIGSSDQAFLNCLSFEGATKRNKPNVNVGDVIFGKLVVASKDMEPELTCIDPANGKANGMGIVPTNGFLFQVSLNLVHKLLTSSCPLLPQLGKKFSFEIIIGLNGKILLYGKSSKHIIAIMNLIVASEFLSNEEILTTLSVTSV